MAPVPDRGLPLPFQRLELRDCFAGTDCVFAAGPLLSLFKTTEWQVLHQNVIDFILIALSWRSILRLWQRSPREKCSQITYPGQP